MIKIQNVFQISAFEFICNLVLVIRDFILSSLPLLVFRIFAGYVDPPMAADNLTLVADWLHR